MNLNREWNFIIDKIRTIKNKKTSFKKEIFNLQLLLILISKSKNKVEKKTLEIIYKDRKLRLCQYQIINQ
jgi:hypothetical protein